MEKIEINGKSYVLESSIKNTNMVKPKTGLTYCIVRTYSAGVFAGWYDRKTKGKEGTVFNARRIWYWENASSLSELSMKGVTLPNKCKFPCEVPEIDLKEIIEICPCSEKGKKSIEEVPEWKQH